MLAINQSKRTQLIFFGIVVWILNSWHLFHLIPSEKFSIEIFSYLFVYFFAFISFIFFLYPFYSKDNRGFGIEDHFKKMYLLIHFLILLLHGFNWFFDYPWGLIIFILTFSVIALGSNFILFYLHFIDQDKTPPNYFYGKSWKEDF